MLTYSYTNHMYLIAAVQLLAQQIFHLRKKSVRCLLLQCQTLEFDWCFDIAESLEVNIELLVSSTNIMDGFEYAQSVRSAA